MSEGSSAEGGGDVSGRKTKICQGVFSMGALFSFTQV